jgi:hypothetical protein
MQHAYTLKPVRIPELPLQRIEGASRQAVTSPTRLNRHGVSVTYRVLHGSEVSGILGSPFPVRPQRSPNAWPCRSSFIYPRSRTRLLEQSSHGVPVPYTVFPMSPPAASRLKAPLLGFLFPYSARGKESSRLAGCPVELPGFAGNLSTGPTLPTTVPLAGFPNLSAAFFLSPPSCHFQAGGAHGVPSFRGLFLPRRPGCSSPPDCPLDVPPVDCAAPVPRRGHPWAHRPLPRILGSVPLIVFRAFVFVEIDLRHQATINVKVTDLPLLDFRLLMVCTLAIGGDSSPHPSSLHGQQVRRQTCHSLRPTACQSPGPALCHQRTVPSQGSSPSTASPVQGANWCGLIRCLFASARRAPHGAVSNLFAPVGPPANARGAGRVGELLREHRGKRLRHRPA